MPEPKIQKKTSENEKPDEASTSEKKAEENNTDNQSERQMQIDAWQAKLDSGEATLKDVSHPWIRKALKPSQTDLEGMISRKVEEELAISRAKDKEKSLAKELDELKLNKESREAIDADVQNLVESGLPVAKALETVLKSERKLQDAIKRRSRGADMALPPAGQVPTSKKGKTLDDEDITDDEILEILQAE